MAEKKGVGHAYNVDFLNVVFAASSLFLFLSVIWMVWDDYDREWKNTQRRFVELETQVTQAQPRAGRARRRPEQAGRSSQAQLAAAQKNVAANQQKVDELQGKLARARRAAVPRDAGLPVRQGDLRPGPLRLRGGARRRRVERRAQGRGGRGAGEAADRAEPAASRRRRPSATALQTAARRSSPARSATIQKQIDELHAEQTPAAQAGSTSSRRAS